MLGANTADRARNAVMDDLPYAIQEKQDLIDQNNYRGLHLNCRCSKCGKKQLWSSFWPIGGTLRGIGWVFGKIQSNDVKAFLGFLMFFVVMGLIALPIRLPAVGIPVLVLLILPSVIAAVQNIVLLSKIKKLNEENLPKIEIEPINQ